MRSLVLSTLFALGFISQGFSQDYVSAAAQFKDEVASFDQIQVTAEPVVVFTGSSSVRLYKNVAELSDKVRILNTGFGGSTAYGLLTYLDQTVLRFKPKQVFIYEAANGVAAGRTNATIIAHLHSIFQRIWADLPDTQIVYIAAKPSPLRWALHQQYEALNSAVERWATREKRLEFADVYSPMLDGPMVREDLFIEDRLHMNEKGYALWDQVIGLMILR